MKELPLRRSPYSTIVYCDKCGEYLGDLIDEVLYKFGRVITEEHICKSPSPRIRYPRKGG